MEQTERGHWIRLGGFAFALVVVSLVATWAGLSGSWVGDDWHMVNNYLYSDWAELGAVFERNAAYYLFTEDKVGPYRPATMLTLLATHLVVPEPWLHHMVSWLLHVATALLLFTVLREQSGDAPTRTTDAVAAVLAALFFLHPVHVESYVWINGRSDLLGGFWLVALAFVLAAPKNSSSPRVGPALVVGVVAFLGASSKLPFVIAAGAVWLAWAVRERSAVHRVYGAAIALGVGAHFVLRMVFAPFRGQLGTSGNILLDTGVWLSLPKLMGKGTEALLTFRAEAMQSLSWTLFGPWSFADWVGLAVTVFVLLFLARRRDWPSLIYVVGALLTLAPVVVVSRSFWMGFDRYLYMPSILVLLAVTPYAARAASRSPGGRLAVGSLAFVALLFTSFTTHEASKAYASQEAYDRALMVDHPADPSIHYYFARAADRSGDEAGLRERLSAMPPLPWPRPIIAPIYELAAKISDATRAHQAIDALVASKDDGVSCTEIRQQLETWRDRAPHDSIADALTVALDGLSCD
jgi:hypothetical protein